LKQVVTTWLCTRGPGRALEGSRFPPTKGLPMLKALIPAVLLALSSVAYAQAPAGDATKARTPRFDCSKASDPKACEDRRGKMKAAHEKAAKACESKPEGERRNCVRLEMCKQSDDPAKCEARAKERQARRAKVGEACKGKQGEEFKNCVREQRQKK
jgi:hypothetical protein